MDTSWLPYVPGRGPVRRSVQGWEGWGCGPLARPALLASLLRAPTEDHVHHDLNVLRRDDARDERSHLDAFQHLHAVRLGVRLRLEAGDADVLEGLEHGLGHALVADKERGVAESLFLHDIS